MDDSTILNSFGHRGWVNSLFGWAASDPAYRIPAQLSLISLFLGTFWGWWGLFSEAYHSTKKSTALFLGINPMYSSAAPSPGSPSPEAK